jgi:transposase InsO family protein
MRYRTIEYGLNKLLKTEKKVAKRLERAAIRRYEKSYPGEMVHADTKLLPRLTGETKAGARERLYVAIDDFSLCFVADIMPDKSQESSAVFGEITQERLPFDIRDWYTDRGTEWKGTSGHAFVMWCKENGISQHFTKPRTPQTNGKAERVIRTLMEEWHRKNRFASREERRRSLYAYVDHFNHERIHGSLGTTPIDRITDYANKVEGGDNAG